MWHYEIIWKNWIEVFSFHRTWERTGWEAVGLDKWYLLEITKKDDRTALVESVTVILTAWKVSEYGVLSGPYFPVSGLNAEINVHFSRSVWIIAYRTRQRRKYSEVSLKNNCFWCWTEMANGIFIKRGIKPYINLTADLTKYKRFY